MPLPKLKTDIVGKVILTLKDPAVPVIFGHRRLADIQSLVIVPTRCRAIRSTL